MSYYLKYRPQKINELDLDTVRNTLSQILSSNTFSHAYLFSGPKGTGKTSSARILAKVLNCEKNKPGDLNEPCGVCSNCKEIQAGTSINVMEMDAASNRGIDDIRELKSRVSLSPSQGRYAVYVIDEVHMLTKEAFNALLKTLEEPPEHAVFILATTEAYKIPDTIISRCTRVQFTKATPKEIERSINKAVKGEKLEPDTDALEALSKRVDGSFRDAMKLVEQLAQKSQSFTNQDVDDLTGYANDYDADIFIQALLDKDASSALAELALKESQGVNSAVFTSRAIEQVRTMLMNALASQKSVKVEQLRQLATLFLEASKQIKYSPMPMLPFELVTIKWCAESSSSTSASISLSADQLPKDTQNTSKIAKPKRTSVKSDPSPKDSPKSVSTPTKVASTIDIDKLSENWQDILKAIKPHNHSLEALLRSAVPVDSEKDWLTLGVYYSFHHDQLNQDKHRQIIESVISEYLGERVKVKCVLTKKPKDTSETKTTSEKTSKTVPVDSASEKQEIEGGGQDLVEAATEIFGA